MQTGHRLETVNDTKENLPEDLKVAVKVSPSQKGSYFETDSLRIKIKNFQSQFQISYFTGLGEINIKQHKARKQT